MWSSGKSSLQGGSLQRILKIAFAVLVVLFLWLGFVKSTPANAVAADWMGANISYGGKTFTPGGTANGTKPPGIPAGSPIYIEIDGTRANIIYFPPDSDFSVATNGTLKSFTYDPTRQTFSSPSAGSSVEVSEQDEEDSVSCAVGLGMGWVLCPVTNTMAAAMDFLFGMITSFLEVQPLTVTNTDDSLFKAWDAMRQIANVGFIIIFLILIYSQLTSVGVSNYGIKKLLPSMIIGAILVNLSWIIAALAVDLSNIMGYALQDFFMSLRTDLFTFNDTSDGSLTSWESLSQFILSAGTVGTAVAVSGVSLLVTPGVSIAATLWLLLPILTGVIISAVVVVMIFAARQALLIILIIIAPLAFIARILPNTANLYQKWYSTMMTMLIFFPAISILFGGSQLAGSLIIQNATSLNIVILGMAVQVAPLVLAPFVLKFSGSLLGKLGGMLNSQKAKAVASTRDMAEKRAKFHQQRSLAGLNYKGEKIDPRKKTPLRNIGRRLNHRSQRLADTTANYEKLANARYLESEKYQDVFKKSYQGDQAVKGAESVLERDLKRKVLSDKSLLKQDMDTRLKTTQAELQNLKLDSTYQRLAAGDTSKRPSLSRISAGAEEATRDISLTSMAKNNSQRIQHTNLSDALAKNTATIDGEKLRDYAGGADIQYGADSALASAITIQAENDAKLSTERAKLISHFNLNGKQRQQLAMGEIIATPVIDDKGNSYTFDAKADSYLRSAAAEVQFTKGSADDKLAIVASTGIDKHGVKGVNYDIRTEVSDLIAKTGLPNSIAWLGGVSMDKVTRGEVFDKKSLDQLVFDHIQGGRFKAEQWYTNDASSIQYAIDVIGKAPSMTTDPAKLSAFRAGVASLQSQLTKAGENDNISSRASSVTINKINELLEL